MQIPIELIANLDDHLSDHDIVFHYTKYETAINHIIPAMKLRFGRFTKANDPKEFTNLDPTISRLRSSHLPEDTFFKYARAQFNKLTHEHVRMICFCRNTKLKGYIKPRMWAQYGRQMKGVCLALSKKQLAIDASKIRYPSWHGNVKYTYSLGNDLQNCSLSIVDAKSTGDIKQQIMKRALNLIPQVYFEKFVDFRDETEWRIVCLSKSMACIDISESLRSIIVGSEVDEHQLDTIKNISPGHLEIQKLDWNPQGPTLLPINDPNGLIAKRIKLQTQ